MTVCTSSCATGSLPCPSRIFSSRRWRQTTASPRRSCVRIVADLDVQPGARIRVSQEVKVFHAPKHKSGLSLEGMEGTVTAVVKEHKGKELSANLPIRVQFALPAADGRKETKLIAHLVRLTPRHPSLPGASHAFQLAPTSDVGFLCSSCSLVLDSNDAVAHAAGRIGSAGALTDATRGVRR